MIREEANLSFKRIFHSNPEIEVFAPGRVNLIGEHTDYNNGFVLPFALPFQTIIVGSRTYNKESRIYSCSIENCEVVSFEINQFLQKGEPKWANYVKGVIFQYLSDLPINASFDAVIHTNIPLGSGLSSSAALEVAVGTFLENLFYLTNINGVTKALRCQQAEHTFGDTPCGIMDQYISAMGKKNNLLLIDCRSQDYELVPFGTSNDGPILLVTNSLVKHSLSDSEYPVRVKQCKEAVHLLQQKYPEVKSLRDATLQQLESLKSSFDSLIYKRALHCITEDARTLETVESLKNNNYSRVGELMTQSHHSLQYNYEVSCEEIDYLVQIALQVPGVLGSRITGGGFGGCTITLVERNSVNELKRFISQKYHEKYSNECVFYECLPCDGSGLINDSRIEQKTEKKSTNYSCLQSEPTTTPESSIISTNKLTLLFQTVIVLGLFYSIKSLTRK